ncbi:FAD-dependent oxidoreductase [soil metagenome]
MKGKSKGQSIIGANRIDSNTNQPQNCKRAVLLGAGHAHLHTIRHAARFTRRGQELLLIAPGPFWYSGLATGMLGGRYPPEQDQVDVAALIGRGGGRFLQGLARAINPKSRTVQLEEGPPLRYDVLSVNLGSEVPEGLVPGLVEHGSAVKPISNLWRLREALEDRFRSSGPGAPVRIVVVGGGASGCEVSANLRRLAEDRGGVAEITLLSSGDRLLEGLPERASAGVVRSFRDRGIVIRSKARADRVEPGEVILDDGLRLPFDVLVASIGLVPPPILGRSGLPTDDRGALLVDDHLRSLADPLVFGGGDCIALQGRPLARIGVYAIRQAPVLLHNLLATLEGQGRPLRRFRPQSRFLLILNLGDGTGLATWGPFHWQGRLAFRWKDWIDRRFLSKYR